MDMGTMLTARESAVVHWIAMISKKPGAGESAVMELQIRG
jgi:hypothetical protein